MNKQWDSFVAQWPDFELMQSHKWSQFKQATGWKAIRLAVLSDEVSSKNKNKDKDKDKSGQWLGGALMLIKSFPLALASIAYIPRGPLIKWENEMAVKSLLTAIHTQARQHRAIILKIEPPLRYSPEVHATLEAYGFKQSQFNNQPQCSMLIDLTPDTDTILANMNATTRYNIRYSERKGVIIREATEADWDNFYKLMVTTAKRANFTARSEAYYRQQWDLLIGGNYAKLFLATYNNKILAVRMPAIFGNKAATLHSASSGLHKNLKPNELLMWHSIQWAKSQGCTMYDVWGIPDEVGHYLSQNKPIPKGKKGGLWGVYRFKQGFGGQFIYYAGAYDYVYSKPLYNLMNTTIFQVGSLEKLAQLGDKLNLKSILSSSSIKLNTRLNSMNTTKTTHTNPSSLKSTPNKYHCMVVQAYYPVGETRVQRQAEALIENGYQVDIICMKLPSQSEFEIVNGVNIYRLPARRLRHQNLGNQLKEYFQFLLLAFFKVTQLYNQKQYAVVQVHNLPDLLVFCAIWPKLNGAKVILDIHDVMPEFFAAKINKALGHPLVQPIFWQEWLACRFADHVITVTELWRQALIQRTVAPHKCSVVMNVADSRYFNQAVKSQVKNRPKAFHLIYHGILVQRYGIDLVLRAFAIVKKELPDIELTIHGRGNYMEALMALAEDLNLGDSVHFSTTLLPLEDLPKLILSADVGLVPYHRDIFTDGILPTKLMEYTALGIPAIVARTPGIAAYFDDTMVEFFTPDNIDDLVKCIKNLYYNQDRLKTLANNTAKFNQKYSWSSQITAYTQLIETITTKQSNNKQSDNFYPLQKKQVKSFLLILSGLLLFIWSIYKFIKKGKNK